MSDFPLPDSPPPAPAEGGSVLAEIWKNLFPWDDLNAKGPPERWLKLGLEILPALAVLVAQNPARPKLLTADLTGQLLTSANISPSVQAIALSPGGQPVVQLPDTSIFHPNDVVNITSGLITPPQGTSTNALVKSVQPGSITLQSNLQAKCDVGDVVMRMPVTASFGLPVFVATAFQAANGNLVRLSGPFSINVAIGAGGAVTLIAGVGGQTIFLASVTFNIDPAQAGNAFAIRDSLGVPTDIGSGGELQNGPFFFPMSGAPLTLGAALVLFTTAATTFRGQVIYGQG